MLIGRKKEIADLERLYNSDKSEFVAVYGRRRVGKTFLINETYGDRIVFHHTGLPFTGQGTKKARLELQLSAFFMSLIKWGMADICEATPKTWIHAFHLLEIGIIKKYSNKRVVIFIDELPWMETPNSFFLEVFSNFWNNFCFPSKNIVLVVCGSASSWILNNVVYDKGGLYNRVTFQIRLSPFNLKEVEEYLLSKDMRYSRYEIVQLYMMIGGIPYYLDYFKNNLSVAQNIDALFFNDNCYLPNEFNDLFSSQFTDFEKFKGIVEVLGEKGIGYSIQDIVSKLELAETNGKIYEMVDALITGGFITSYIPFKGSKRIKMYKLIDPFCLFYFKHIKNNNFANSTLHNYVEMNINSPKLNSWRGFAFENLCFYHINQIKKKMSILGIYSEVSMWFKKGDENTQGAQVDLIIDRKDNVINLCEIKFYSGVLSIDKEFHLNLMNKMEALSSVISKKKSIQNVLITTFGLSNSNYSSDFPTVIIIDDLFD